MAPIRQRTGLGALGLALVMASACSSGGSLRSGPTGPPPTAAGTTTPVTSTTTPPPPSAVLTSNPQPPATTGTTQAPATRATATATAGGLTVTLTVSPATAAAGATVQVSVTASESHAKGALGYQLAYGDGATAQNAEPMFCLSGPGAAQSQSWNLPHRYAAAGAYRVSVAVTANCTTDRATASVPLSVTA